MHWESGNYTDRTRIGITKISPLLISHQHLYSHFQRTAAYFPQVVQPICSHECSEWSILPATSALRLLRHGMISYRRRGDNLDRRYTHHELNLFPAPHHSGAFYITFLQADAPRRYGNINLNTWRPRPFTILFTLHRVHPLLHSTRRGYIRKVL